MAKYVLGEFHILQDNEWTINFDDSFVVESWGDVEWLARDSSEMGLSLFSCLLTIHRYFIISFLRNYKIN